MFLDFLGGMVLTAITVVIVNVVITALVAPRTAKLVLGSIIGLWIGLQVSLATAGAFVSSIAGTVPLIGIVLATPLLAAATAAAVSPAIRAAMLGLPLPLLVGLNVPRVLGVFFLLLAWDGRLGGPFPQSAGWGDIVTGIAAVPLAFMAARATPRTALLAWNIFGAADLIVAVALGILSANGFAFQLIEAGAGSDAVTRLPWSLIPTVLVPFYLIMHGIVFAQLRGERARLEVAGA